MSMLGQRAVVLGAGLAGLLSARVLSDFYETVTVIERDALADSPSPRKAVPQGRHLHSLLSRGSQALDELFPGLLNELVAAGVNVVDDGDLSRIYTRMGRHELNRVDKFADPAPLVQYLPSRPVLEYQLRRRVRDLDNTEFRDDHDVIELLSAAPHHVTGVRVADRRATAATALDADLIIDATGRATRTPAFLEALGYDRPPQKPSSAQGIYYSQHLKVPAEAIPEKLVLVITRDGSPSGGLVAAENDTYLLTVTGLGDNAPPTGLDDMLAIAKQFAPPTVLSGLRQAEPHGEVATYRYGGGAWRRYDQMPVFPAGLLVIGDALCTLNPLRGQGMTMAALQALALRDTLCDGRADLAEHFYSAAAECIAPTWYSNEFQEPSAHENTTSSISRRLATWFTNRALSAARTDIVLTERFFRVANLVDSPASLQDPAIAARVLLSSVTGALTRRASEGQR